MTLLYDITQNVQVSENFNLLIAEDDHLLATSLKLMIPNSFRTFIVKRPEDVPGHIFFHAAFVDMHLSQTPAEGPDGIHVVRRLVERNPHTEIVAMSGEVNRPVMDAALHAGAQRFLAKPLMSEEVTLVLEKILAYWQLRELSLAPHAQRKLVGSSSFTEGLRKQISTLRNETTPVLIEGETGTGKEVVANLLNVQEGKRPFIAVNCAAIPENLFESELFGHVKGAFTGAETSKIGLVEAANGGDLFLDEIEALPLTQQAKLLRFLESGETRKLGAKESVKVTVRVIAASNRSLKKMVSEKTFREDLYFRLSAHIIQLIPLRERTDDIKDLAQFFLDQYKTRRNKSFDTDALTALTEYSWPGNVRELKRICDQLVLVSALPIITANDVNRLILKSGTASNSNALSDDFESLDSYLAQQEKNLIQNILNKTKSIDQTCERLKVSKSSLYKKIKDYGITHD